MSHLNWEEIILNEDRIISNSDRKYRAHFVSLEVIPEDWLYHISAEIYSEEQLDFSSGAFTETIKFLPLAKAIKELSPKQSQVINLIFWEGFKGYEVANIMRCSSANVSIHLGKALQKMRLLLENQ